MISFQSQIIKLDKKKAKIFYNTYNITAFIVFSFASFEFLFSFILVTSIRSEGALLRAPLF